jgi:hypothetical protein
MLALIIRSFAALCLAMLLSGCFVSDEPLITPKNADYPIPHGAVFVKSSTVRTQTEYEPFDNAVLISRDYGDTVRREGGYYVHEETGANGIKNLSRGLMKKIDGKTYLVMGEDKEQGRYWYGLFVQDGEEWVQYKVLCDDLVAGAKRAVVPLEDFGAVRTPSGACKFTSLDKLMHAIKFAQAMSPKAREWARYKKPPARPIEG